MGLGLRDVEYLRIVREAKFRWKLAKERKWSNCDLNGKRTGL